MALIDSTVIIADDLTGANDTALQFFKKGCSSKIIIDVDQDLEENSNVDIWAISTESRNTNEEEAVRSVVKASEKLKDSLNAEKFYKKIDSTLRGNTGVEIIALLEVTQKDVALVAPAYIEEGRTTVGGYQLLNGMVIERTQCALDPKAPIYDSYIPDILKKNLNPQLFDLIDVIGFNTVVKGAGPIVLKINELVQKGKKVIVIDALSNTDLEQIALAIEKSSYDILPCGSAGLANALSKTRGEDVNIEHDTRIPNYPRLIISGSATQLTAKQIEKLKEEEKNIFFVDLNIKDIIEEVKEEMVQEIVQKLNQGIDVVVHSSNINKEILDEEAKNQLIDAGIAKNEFAGKITDFLSDLTFEIEQLSKFILIIIGGETSYKCATKIDSRYLKVLDAIMPAIPLCIDANNKIIVTKSGNFGTNTTLCDILNYFNKIKNENV